MISLKSSSELEKMRRSGAALAGVFAAISPLVQAGIATAEIDRAAEGAIRDSGAIPAFKNYRGGNRRPFPASACISIDEAVVHGIPSERVLESGQIVGIDIGLVLDGWFADMAGSYLIGDVTAKKRMLWRVTREALYKGIAAAVPGSSVDDVGGAIQDWVQSHGHYVVRELVGHGIGSRLHEEPAVPNYRTHESTALLKPGMTLAIEPMVASGTWGIKILSDGWTAVTADGSPSGHFEHTVVVRDGPADILTLLEDGSDPWQTLMPTES